MLIRHDPHLSRGRVLMPVPRREWMRPSQAEFKDEFGNPGVRTLFRLRARLHDGHVVWAGWFEDRDAADAFLFALATGSLRYERELWRLPTPEWHPGIGENLSYEFATQTFLTTTGVLTDYTSPSDWNNSNNTIECLGGGGSGGRRAATVGHETGAGGGAYSKISNFSFAAPGTTIAQYQVGAGGASSFSNGSNAAGAAGNPTWFNNATDPGNGADNTKCSAAGGGAGANGTGSRNGGTGGATTASWGETKYAGGRGGNLTGASGSGASGGGGAAGPSGAGGNGVDSTSTGAAISTDGGTSNNGTLAGGVASAGDGSNGTEFSASYGSGSGGAGAAINTVSGGTTGGDGGNYGAGGGGGINIASPSGSVGNGAGKQGLIVVTYTPVSFVWNPRQSFQHILVR